MRRIIIGLLLGLSTLAHAQEKPFLPMGATTNVAVTATAGNLTLPVNPFPGTAFQIILSCLGTQTCFVRNDGVTATVSNATPVLPNGQFVISVSSTVTTLSVIAAGAGSTIYATAGLGY